MHKRTATTKTASFSGLQKMIFSALVLACLVFTLNVAAVEIKPTDSGNPVELTPDFDGLGSANQLLQDKANGAKLKKKHSWWTWLTGTSRKPANFHYIDFMELFHQPH